MSGYIVGAVFLLIALGVTIHEVCWHLNMNRRQRKLEEITRRFNFLRGLPPSPELIEKHRELLREIDDV